MPTKQEKKVQKRLAKKQENQKKEDGGSRGPRIE